MKYILLVAIYYSPLIVFCQTRFMMTTNEGHYYINAPLNGINCASVFIESGLPGILINKENYNKYFTDSLLETVDSGYTEIKYLYGSHNVLKIKQGTVSIGDMSYKGVIYVVDKYNEIGVPVHLLTNEKDTINDMLRIDFKNNILSFISQDSISKLNFHKYNLKETIPEPVIETTIWLSDKDGHNGVIKGEFIIDLGNKSPLYLFSRNQRVLNFLKENKFSIRQANDREGRNIGYGINAHLCKIGERSVKNVAIGITNKVKISNTMGCIGPSMYASSFLIFDTKNMLVYYQ